jgi:competence protein ComEA
VIERMHAIVKAQKNGTPPSVRPARIIAPRPIVRSRLGPSHVRALAIVLVGALVVSVGYVLISIPRDEVVMAQAPTTNAAASPEVVGEVFVHVAGDVQHPGVYTLPLGSRVIDAVTAAGGVLAGADTTSINLARVLDDGEQVVVGVVATRPESHLVDLNSATEADLDRLPGIGPVLAQRILAWRSDHGRFRSVEQLKDVSGVGGATFASLRKLIVVR